MCQYKDIFEDRTIICLLANMLTKWTVYAYQILSNGYKAEGDKSHKNITGIIYK